MISINRAEILNNMFAPPLQIDVRYIGTINKMKHIHTDIYVLGPPRATPGIGHDLR